MGSQKLKALALAAFAWAAISGGALAAKSPVGVWIDHTGRGAIEIKKCGSKLCGMIVWAKKKADLKKGCGKKLIGNLRPLGKKTWGQGWIYSPEKQRRFDLEITPLSRTKLQLLGYMGSKLFSKKMIWSRAPANLARCDAPKVDPNRPIIAKKTAPKKPAKKVAVAAKPAVKKPAVAVKVPQDIIKPPAPKLVQRAAIAPMLQPPALPVEPQPKQIATRSSDDAIGEKLRSGKIGTLGGATPIEADAQGWRREQPKLDAKPVNQALASNDDDDKGCTIKLPFVTLSFPCKK